MSGPATSPGIWKRLAGNKLLHIAVAYPLVAWVVMQVAEVMLPNLGLPGWSVTLVIVLAILGYPIALLLGWAAMRGDRAGTDEVADEHSIAVLAFADMSEDADQAYFCEGMAAEIINDLARVSSLKVASRTSSFSYRNSDQDARQIGRDLKVASILEGSVRKSGKRLRVDAQLIDVRNGYHLWSERYDRELHDVFAIQDEIARNIVKALRIQLTPQEARALSLPLNCTPEAYEYYLKGMHQFHRFRRGALETAVKWFEKALEECNSFAPAYAGLANALSYIYLFQEARADFCHRAKLNAERALELDPTLAEAHAALGLAKLIEKEYEASERAFRRALELNPELFEAHYQYARMLWTRGRIGEAIAEFKRAADLNPEDYQSPNLLVSLLQDDTQQADRRRYAEMSVQRSLKWLEHEPDDARAMYLMAGSMIVLDRREEAVQWADRAITMQPTSDTYYNVACVYVGLGDKERAIDLLEAADMRGRNYDWMVNDPDLAPLKGHPRFEAVLETLR